MRILIQAVRAVFVELLGVLLVLWLLFGSVTWTLESAGSQPNPAALPNLLATIKSSVAGQLSPTSGATAEEADYVSQRLDYYSRLYGRAATGYFRQVTENLSKDLSSCAPQQRPGGRGQVNTL